MTHTIDTVKAAMAAFDEGHYEAIWSPEPNRVQAARNYADMNSYTISAWSELARRANSADNDVWDTLAAQEVLYTVGKYL